jgi:hypothetical protein
LRLYFRFKETLGLIVETRNPGGCALYPFNHFVAMETPSWPDDAPVQLPKIPFASVLLANNELVFSDETGFESEMITKIKNLSSSYNIKNLSFDEFYHVLAIGSDDRLCLVGLRSKATLDLELKETIIREAEKAGLHLL